jgi:hypothetical protein
MGGLNFECDTAYALNLVPTEKARVGYLMSFNGLGGLSLKSDIELFNPFNSKSGEVLKGTKVKCVGIVEKFAFGGDVKDPIRIAAYLSTANAAALRGKMTSGVKSTKLKFSFALADYDLDAKAWFEAAIVQGDKKASAAIDTMDGVLQIFCDAEPRRLDPNFDIVFCRMVFQAAPEPKQTSNLRFATGSTQKVVLAWGS